MATTPAPAPVALVTGCSSGFGLLAAVSLARAGHRVYASMRDPGKRAALDAAAAAAGVALTVVRLDVTDRASVAEATERIEREAGPVDVLVNNAGYGLGGFFEDVSLDEFREQLETNFFGVIAVTQAVLPGMRGRRRGRIINVSSISGRIGTPGVSAYVSSKWALEGLSESIRIELAPFGIDVVLIEPGSYPTEVFTGNRRLARRMTDPSSPYVEQSKQLERVVNKLMAKMAGRDPQEVADAIVRAATVRRPRLRYLVGSDALGEALAKALLPFSVFEWGVRQYLERAGR